MPGAHVHTGAAETQNTVLKISEKSRIFKERYKKLKLNKILIKYEVFYWSLS